jgi:hypothetical protein
VDSGDKHASALTPNAQRSNLSLLFSTFLRRRRDRAEILGLIGRGFLHFAQAPPRESSPSFPPGYGWGEAWRDLVISGGHLKEDLREYARARCAEQLRKERTYELPGHLRGKPVAVNATVGGKFDASELRHLKPAPNGLFPWFDASDKMIWLTPRQVGSLANQTKIYETRVYAVHARALLRIASSVITTPAEIDALNWPS